MSKITLGSRVYVHPDVDGEGRIDVWIFDDGEVLMPGGKYVLQSEIARERGYISLEELVRVWINLLRAC